MKYDKNLDTTNYCDGLSLKMLQEYELYLYKISEFNENRSAVECFLSKLKEPKKNISINESF